MKPDRHGDVLLIPIDKIPAGAKPIAGTTLAEGEMTGHSHKFPPGAIQMFQFEDRFFMKVQKKIAVLNHEEHGAFEYKEGDVREIKIQREYKPGGWTRVLD